MPKNPPRAPPRDRWGARPGPGPGPDPEAGAARGAASGVQFGHSPAETGNVRGDDFTVALARSRFIGAVESAAGTCSAGSWGVYTGPNLDGGKVMERIVARDLTDTGSGCMGTVYRVRQLGIGAAFDVFGDEAALRHYWPDQAEEALNRFESNQPQPMRQ